MTQKPKKPSKPKAGENIIHSDEGKQTFLKREILVWRDGGLLDDPYNLIDKPTDDRRTRLDVMAESLNWINRINETQCAHSFRNNSEKPYGGYYKVKRGHRWQTMRYEGAIEIQEELSASQLEIFYRVFKRAEELRKADTDPAQLNPRPTGHSRFYADLTYRKYDLPTGSKRYAIRKGATMNEKASWIGDRTEEWLALGLPDLNRKVVNALTAYMTPDPAIPESIEIYEAHQLPQFFDFSIDSDVSAAAVVHEAALSVERLESLLPADSFQTLVGAAMLLQFKLTTLGDMTARADPSDPNSPTISESVELGSKQAKENRERGKKTGGKNREDKETKKEFVLEVLLKALASRKLTKAKAIDLIRAEWELNCHYMPKELPHRTAERYINELRRSGLIPEWK